MSSSYEKLEYAIRCFHELQQEYAETGREITISSVAKRAKIDRKYFYGVINTPDKVLLHRWIALGAEIKGSKKKKLAPAGSAHIASIEDKLKNCLTENYKLLEKLRESAEVKKRLEGLLLSRKMQVERLEKEIRGFEIASPSVVGRPSNVVSLKKRKIIISPDNYREGNDPLSLKKAWVKALNEFRAIIERKKNIELFVTMGLPASGKSTWSDNFTDRGKFSVVFDACNLTKVDRFDLLELVSNRDDIRVVGVVFVVPLDVLIERNSLRISGDRVSEAKMRAMHDVFESPGIFDGLECFDELMIVRS